MIKTEGLSKATAELLENISQQIEETPSCFAEYGQYWFKLKSILQERITDFPFTADPDYTSFYPFENYDKNGNKLGEMSDEEFINAAVKFAESNNHNTVSTYQRYWYNFDSGEWQSQQADLVDHDIGYSF